MGLLSASVLLPQLNFRFSHLPFQHGFACVEWVACAGHII
jgi:hypothetical protein